MMIIVLEYSSVDWIISHELLILVNEDNSKRKKINFIHDTWSSVFYLIQITLSRLKVPSSANQAKLANQ